MVRITKAESQALHELGIRYGENGISHTTSRHSHKGFSYYLTETIPNMRKLKKLRNAAKVNN